MTRTVYAWLVCCAWWELARYDLLLLAGRLDTGRPSLGRRLRRTPARYPDVERRVCDALLLATCLYVKPVLCLQRSIAAARLLRARGIDARLVIGFRAVPFFSHAWVDVDGRVVNDSPVYQQRLQVLFTS